MDEILVTIGLSVLMIVMIGAAIVGTWIGSMSDKEREKYGLGPKGQGRR